MAFNDRDDFIPNLQDTSGHTHFVAETSVDFRVRLARREDIGGIVDLQRACFPAPFPEELLWQPEHIQAHIERFPEGQLVAESRSQIVASGTNMRLSEADWKAHRSFEETTGGLFLTAHDPTGTVLYGIDISVHPQFRKMGIARAIYAERFELARRLGGYYATVCRMPGFRESGLREPSDYAWKVAKGLAEDSTITPLLRIGLEYKGVLENYMDDPESGHAGAILEQSHV